MALASHVDVKKELSNPPGLYAAVTAIRDSQLNVDDYIAACLRRVEAEEGRLRALVRCDYDYAEKRAYVFDRMPSNRREPIHGIPCVAAATIDIKGSSCGFGSELHRDRIATDDAAIIAQARKAGAIVLGTAASAEFGCFGAGAIRNPYAEDRSAGGSGAAAAVAAGMAPLAFERRVDGAISIPASYCGVFGLKVSRGAIAANGMLSLAPSLEATGFYVRNALDVGFVARVFLGHRAPARVEAGFAPETGGLAVHILDGPSSYRIKPAARSALNRAIMALSDKRVDVARLRLSPACVKAESCYDTIFSYEVARKLARDRDREPERMGAEAQSRIDHGRRIDAGAYEQSRRDAIGMRSELLDHLTGDTVILDVASEDVAPPHDTDSGWSPGQALWALAGIPTLGVPCGMADGLPVGVQIAAAPGREDLLARVAGIIEDRIGQ